MMLAPKIVGNSGRRDSYAVLSLWIGPRNAKFMEIFLEAWM